MKTRTAARRTADGEGRGQKPWRLRLYVAGQTPRSRVALANLKRICDSHLANRYVIEIIDLLERPQLSKGDQIVAIPTLVRRLPRPMRKIIGDLSDTQRVLIGLNLARSDETVKERNA